MQFLRKRTLPRAPGSDEQFKTREMESFAPEGTSISEMNSKLSLARIIRVFITHNYAV